jgi:hypothetical protein
MKETADESGGKPIAVLLLSISGLSAINLLVAFYDIHGGKREGLFLYFVPVTTRDYILIIHSKHPDPIQTDMFMHTNVCTVRESNPRPFAQ